MAGIAFALIVSIPLTRQDSYSSDCDCAPEWVCITALKSVEVINFKFKVALDLFASKEEGKSDNYIYKGYFQSQVKNPG